MATQGLNVEAVPMVDDLVEEISKIVHKQPGVSLAEILTALPMENRNDVIEALRENRGTLWREIREHKTVGRSLYYPHVPEEVHAELSRYGLQEKLDALQQLIGQSPGISTVELIDKTGIEGSYARILLRKYIGRLWRGVSFVGRPNLWYPLDALQRPIIGRPRIADEEIIAELIVAIAANPGVCVHDVVGRDQRRRALLKKWDGVHWRGVEQKVKPHGHLVMHYFPAE